MSNEAEDILTHDEHTKVTQDASEHQTDAPSSAESLAQMPESAPFAFDINRKIDGLHRELDELTRGFASSSQDFSKSLAELTARIQSETSGIAAQIKQSDQEKIELIEALEIRLSDTSAKSFVLINELEQRLEENSAEKRKLISGLEQQLEKTSVTLGEEIVSLHDHLMSQRTSLNLLQDELDSSNKQLDDRIGQLNAYTQTQVEALRKTDQRQAKTQKIFADHLDELRDRSNTTADELNGLQIDFATEKRLTLKRFKLSAAVAAAIIIGTAGTFTYMQQNNTSLKMLLGTELAAFQSSLDTVFSRKAELAALDEKVTGQQESAQLQTLALQDATTNNANQIAALQLSLYGKPDATGTSGKPSLPLNDNSWLQSLNPNHFTIQLVGVYRKRSVVAFTNRHASALTEHPLAANVTQYRGQEWHNLFYGSFATFSAAQQALDALPDSVLRSNPWIRQVGDVTVVNNEVTTQ